MSAAPLNPAQQRVVDDILAIGTPRPRFAEGINLALLSQLEEGLHDIADRLDPFEVHVNKSALNHVLACETYHAIESATPFAWTVGTARSTIANKAIELAVFAPPGTPPLQLVDDVIERLAFDGDDRSPRDFLRAASAVELAELRSAASNVVTAFESCFPPIEKAWRPRLGAPCRVELCAGRVILRAKVDLVLGRAVGGESRVFIVEVKTGRGWPGHADDLRFYALCETLRSGVPPFRMATYYLESGAWHSEDVTVELLEAAARRVIAGARSLAELQLRERQPTRTPGPSCGFCRQRETCPGAVEWTNHLEAVGLSA